MKMVKVNLKLKHLFLIVEVVIQKFFFFVGSPLPAAAIYILRMGLQEAVLRLGFQEAEPLLRRLRLQMPEAVLRLGLQEADKVRKLNSVVQSCMMERLTD